MDRAILERLIIDDETDRVVFKHKEGEDRLLEILKGRNLREVIEILNLMQSEGR
jgi:hypothetical protein